MTRQSIGGRGLLIDLVRLVETRLLPWELLWLAPGLVMVLVPGLPSSVRWAGWSLALVSWPIRLYCRAFRHTPLDKPFLVLLSGLLIGVYASVDRHLSLEALLSYLAVALLYYAVANHPTTYHLWALTISGMVIALGFIPWVFAQGQIPPSKLLTYNQWAVDLARQLFPRIGPYSPHMNALAGGLNALIPIWLGISLFTGRWLLRIVALVGASLLIVTVAMSGSRAGMVGLSVGVLVVAILRSRWFFLCVPAGIAVICALHAFGFIESGEMLGVTSGQTFIGRTEVWGTTAEMLMDVPFTGVGLASYPLVYPLYMPPSLPPVVITNPHNAILMMLSDAGLLGLTAMIWTGWIVLVIGWRTFKLGRRGAIAGMAAGLTASLAGQAAYGLFESTVSTIFTDTAGAYHYMASPILALLLGMYIIAYHLVVSQPVNPGHHC